MDVSTAGALNLFAYKNALQNNTPAQALQDAVGRSSALASNSSAALAGEVGSSDAYTNTLKQVGEAPIHSASYTLSVQSGNGSSEVESRLASAQPSSSASGLLTSAGLDPRTAGALAVYQVRSAPNAAEAYAQVQAIAANANQTVSRMTISMTA